MLRTQSKVPVLKQGILNTRFLHPFLSFFLPFPEIDTRFFKHWKFCFLISFYMSAFFLDLFVCLRFSLKSCSSESHIAEHRYTFLSQVHAYSRYFIPFHPSRTGYFCKVYLLQMITASFARLCNPSFSSLYILQELLVKLTLNFSSLNPLLGQKSVNYWPRTSVVKIN